jgi:hypothetical protein
MWAVLLGYNDFEADGALLRRSNVDWRPNMAYYCDKVTWKNFVELGEFFIEASTSPNKLKFIIY